MKAYRKILSIILALCLSVPLGLTTFAKDTPKGISTFEDLKKIAKDLDGDYYLENDINLGSKDFETIGNQKGYFKGTLDGKGHTISGLNIKGKKENNGDVIYSGLFAINGGTIKNLNIANAEVNVSGSKYAYAGILAGTNIGIISNCYVSGNVNVSGISVNSKAGGLCGQAMKGAIENCVSYANVYNTCISNYSGGLCGYIEAASVSKSAVYGSIFSNGINATRDCYSGGITAIARSKSKITNCLFAGGVLSEKIANVYSAGIVGKLEGHIEKCVSIGSVELSQITSHRYIGGIGGDDDAGVVGNSYYLKGRINDDIYSKKGKALSEDQIKSTSSFSNLDFGSVWTMKNGSITLNGLPKPSDDAIIGLKGVKIVSTPDKTAYTQGVDNTLNLKGLKVNAVYTSGEVTLKNNEFTISGYNYSKTGKQNIIVTYKGFTDSFEVIVVAPNKLVIDSVEITDGSYTQGNPDGGESKPPKVTDKDKETASEVESESVEIQGGEKSEDSWEDETDKDKENKKEDKKSNIWIYIIIGAVGLVIIFFAGAFIIFSLKKKGSNEISNDDILETEKDENDMY